MLTESPIPDRVPAPPAKRRRRRWPLVLLAVLLLLLWFAPAIATVCGAPTWAARKALAGLKGNVNVGGASLSWFGPVVLRDVTVSDAQGRTILAVPRVTGSKSLVGLLRDSSDAGGFVVERPSIEVVCEGKTTNFEDAFAAILNDPSPPKPTRTAVSVRVTDGKLTVRDGDKSWAFESISASVGIPKSRTEPLTAKVSAGPQLDADVSLAEGGSAKFATTGLPLDALAPVLRRVEPGLTVSGHLTGGATASWGKSAVHVDGNLAVKDLVVGGDALKGDRLALASVELPVKIDTAGGVVNVERVELRCDVGSLAVTGSFDPDEAVGKLFDKPGVSLAADIDLAKLASLLPRVLRVREGTALREGKLTAKLASRASPAGTVWDGEVRTSALKATRDGKPIEWPEPLAIDFSGRAAGGGLPTFDKFVCRSDFVAVNAQGSADSFRAAANVYLDRFAARLSEFVDLGGRRLDGQASAWVIVTRAADGAVSAKGAVELTQFVFADKTGRGLREPQLKLEAWLGGRLGDATRLDTAVVTMAAGADALDVRLAAPIPDVNKLSAGKLSLSLSGDLSKWRERAAAFVSIPKHYVMGGQVKAAAAVEFTPNALTAKGLTIGIDRVRFRGAGLDLDEPSMNAAGDLSVNTAAGSAVFTNVRLNSAPLSLTNATLAFEPQPGGELAVRGNGDAVSDLNRLGKTLKIDRDPRGPNALHGRGVGPLRFRNLGDTTTFGGTLDVTNFAFGDPAKTGISEPALQLEADGAYRTTTDEVKFAAAKFNRPGLAVAGKGTVAKFDTTIDVKLDGTLTYDLAKLSPDLQKAVGGDFRAVGQGTRPFALGGSLLPTFGKTTAELSLNWDSIRAHGFDFGPSDMRLSLARGVLTASPVKAAFGGGLVTVSPTVRLDPGPSELSLAKGTVVNRAKLTPQVCASALGYALPLIARASQAEGEVSVTLDDNRVPLAAPERATVKGQVVVHRAVVGAGPVMGEIAKLLGAQNTSMTLANDMTVPVKVENGRVHHENLRVTVNGYAVSTTGSVGFDGSLALVADVPIPGTLPGLKNNPSLAKALTGKVVKVPIGGTVSHPQLDPRAFQTAIDSVGRDALKDVGRDFLRKELDKVMPKGGPGGLFPFPIPKKQE